MAIPAVDAASARLQWGGGSNGSRHGTNSLSGIINSVTHSVTNASSSLSSSSNGSSSWYSFLNMNEIKTEDLEAQDGSTLSSTTGSVPKWAFWNMPRDSSNDTSTTSIVNWNRRFKGFVAMILLAAFFFGFAVMFIPLIVIRPAKFALSFTLGSIFFMGAFAMLKGPAAYFKKLLDPQYVIFSAFYLSSLGCTLYTCLILRSYLLVVFSSIVQCLALTWFGVSSLPGGYASIKAFSKLFIKTSSMVIRSCLRLITSN